MRQAIAEKLAADNELSYRASQIIVSNGAKHSCYNAILATCQPGDEVIIPAPYWVSYPDMVRLAGAEPVIVPTSERNAWKMRAEDFENAMTPRTKMLILNSPGNPTGSVYTREELQAIVDVAAEEDIYILSDEIYEKLVYDDVEARQRRVALEGSVRSHNHGQRFQQSLRDDRLASRLSGRAGSGGQSGRFHSKPQHLQSLPRLRNTARLAALKGDQQPLADMREEFDMRRNYMFDRDLEDSEHHRGQTAGRVLRSGEHQPARTDLAKFCRSLVEQSECRGRSRRCLRRRSHRPSQLRHQHRRDQKRSRSLPGFLPHAVAICTELRRRRDLRRNCGSDSRSMIRHCRSMRFARFLASLGMTRNI